MSGLPGWCAPYIGVPFVSHGRDRRGVDCWGLVALVYRDVFGIALPDPAAAPAGGYADARDRDAVARLVGAMAPAWRPVAAPAIGDVVLFYRRGVPAHIGVHVAPGRMLHACEYNGGTVDRYPGLLWRHFEHYRHPAHPDVAAANP